MSNQTKTMNRIPFTVVWNVLLLAALAVGAVLISSPVHADGGGGGGGIAVCGDGMLGGFEQCDDGNLNNGDGCSSICADENAPPAPTVAITVTPLALAAPGNVVVTWTSSNATSCSGSGATFDTGTATNGSQTVYVSANTTFMVSCVNNGPNWQMASTYVTVAAPPAPTVTLSASPTSMYEGNSSTLTWSSTNATSCNGSGTGFTTGNAINGSDATGSLAAGSYTYYVTCNSANGQTATASTVVTVSAGTCPGTSCQQVCVQVPITEPPAGSINSENGQVSVSSRQIAFSFNAVNPNNPPTAPVISGPTSRQEYQSGSYGFVSTDPDNDTIRYLVDWNRDGVTDQILPGSGYAASGAQQSATKSWSSTGATSFQARAEDAKGGLSGWTIYNVTVTAAPKCSNGQNDDGSEDNLVDLADPGCLGDPNRDSETPNPPTADLQAVRTSIPVGTATTLTWSCGGTGTLTATISGLGSVSPASGGSISTGNIAPPPGNTPYQLTCSNGSQTAQDSVTITTTVPTVTLTATPDRVKPGQHSALTWVPSADIDTCTVTGTNGFTSSNVSGSGVDSGAIGVHGDTFTANCSSGGVPAAATANVTVNVIPTIDEF